MATGSGGLAGTGVVIPELPDSGNGEPCDLTVEDNGSAIPEEERGRIFEPYHRAHDAPGVAGSMGLGLSVSRQLARLMGGDLTYRYENAQSTFELSLPPAGQNTKPSDTYRASLESAGNPS